MTTILTCALINAASAFDATIRWNDLHQRITGFGASCAWTNVTGMATPVAAALFDTLFDTTVGCGLSMIRAQTPWRLEDASGNWTWTGDNGQVSFMQEAKKRGVKYFWSAPWSPPPWMKTSNNSVGGSLLPAHYQDFADYLSRYIREYKSRFGIDFSGYRRRSLVAACIS
jgi:glucosylceramidase